MRHFSFARFVTSLFWSDSHAGPTVAKRPVSRALPRDFSGVSPRSSPPLDQTGRPSGRGALFPSGAARPDGTRLHHGSASAPPARNPPHVLGWVFCCHRQDGPGGHSSSFLDEPRGERASSSLRGAKAPLRRF